MILLVFIWRFNFFVGAAGLGEFRIRDLNDDINKLIREKGHWEAQIKELGGPDYARVGPRMLDHEGREVPGNRGYKYFGAAKDLPGIATSLGCWTWTTSVNRLSFVRLKFLFAGVRELFEQEPPPPPRKTRGELMREIDADYYGYRDDDDGILIPIEEKEERRGMFFCLRRFYRRDVFTRYELSILAIENAVNRWKQRGDNSNEEDDNEEQDLYAVSVWPYGLTISIRFGRNNRRCEISLQIPETDEEARSNDDASENSEAKFVAHVSVPSQDEIKAALLLRKKQELLERYAGDGQLLS